MSETQPLLAGSCSDWQSGDSWKSIKNRLYVSHALYVWNARVFEFAFALFLVHLFPDSLLAPSIYSLFYCLAGILGASYVAALVTRTERLKVIRRSIFIQRNAVLIPSLSLLAFNLAQSYDLVLESHILGLKITLLCLFTLGGAIEKLCGIANEISMTRDWVVKICHGDETLFLELSVRLRSIDLLCKLVGPTFISLLVQAGVNWSLVFIFLMNIVSNYVEWFAIAKIYSLVPALRAPFPEPTHGSRGKNVTLENLKMFFGQKMAAPVFAMAMLYLTVLSFGTQTVAFLLSFPDINPATIGVLKGVSTVFELSATEITPRLVKRMGLVDTAFVSILSEFCFLCPIFFAFAVNSPYRHWVLCFFIPFSRIGLWGYDIALNNMIPKYVVDVDLRARITAVEQSLFGIFQLAGAAVTIIFSDPLVFKWPVLITMASVGGAFVVYTLFWFRVRRGLLDNELSTSPYSIEDEVPPDTV